MQTIEVTDEQYERLDAIRDALAEDVVYGSVRPRDALEYLLDAHDGDVEVPGAGAVDTADTGSGDDGAVDDAGADGAAVDDAGIAAADGETSDVAADGEESTAADSEEPDDSADDGGTDDGGAGGATADASAGAAGGGDKLSAMMNLLETHDDKWERADSEETRYVVELPDGGTEEVQTKDDVKAILFKKY